MNGREAMGRLAQRVKGVDGKIPAGLAGDSGRAHPAAPSHRGKGRERHGRKPSRRSRPSTWPRPRPACPRPCPRFTGRGRLRWCSPWPMDPGRSWRRMWTRTGPRGGEDGDRGPLPGQRQPGDRHRQEIYPRYQGALLVCAGEMTPVRLQLTEAMSALTGLGADKISISQGK